MLKIKFEYHRLVGARGYSGDRACSIIWAGPILFTINRPKGVRNMITIGEYIREKNLKEYKKLVERLNKAENQSKKKEIKLGDSINNLMKHDAYKRIGRRIRQIKWG